MIDNAVFRQASAWNPLRNVMYVTQIACCLACFGPTNALSCL